MGGRGGEGTRGEGREGKEDPESAPSSKFATTPLGNWVRGSTARVSYVNVTLTTFDKQSKRSSNGRRIEVES